MHPLFEKNLITTKDAGELSGYSSDYLSRLVRSGKIAGEKVGHTWLVDKESLTKFLGTQGDRKIDRARELASARAREYRAHRSLLHRATKTLTTNVDVPEQFISAGSSFLSHALALSVASAVIVIGALAAQAPVIPHIADTVAAVANETVTGFDAAFGDIPTNVVAHIAAADDAMRANVLKVAHANRNASAEIASPMLAHVDLAPLRMAIDGKENHDTRTIAATMPEVNASTVTADDVQVAALDAISFVTSPSQIANALANAYAALGTNAYAAIGASFAAYDSLIARAGSSALTLAASTRDTLATAPNLVSRMNLALGEAIISATHTAIRADVATSYWTVAAAPAAARATVAVIGTTGDTLARATAQVPALATAAYLRATAAPATLAPALAEAVFSAEYAGAKRFIQATNAVSEKYLALVKDTGDVAYTVAAGSRQAPSAIHDAYLGALGKSALALERASRVQPIAAAIAAATPALSASEQVALATYETIHSVFSSVGGTLAMLFAPAPIAVAPNVTLNTPLVIVSTSSKQTTLGTARGTPQTVNSFPTYTTVVQGVSEDLLNRSLASLRTSILSDVSGMIRPVSNQVAQNATTIQYVNMIQKLDGLIVTNGDFRGGSLANATGVSATSGTFTNLTATNLTVSGTATSTFAGNLSVSGNINLNGAILQNNAPLLSSQWTTSGSNIYYSTGNVGVGTTSPYSLLSISNNLNTTANTPLFTVASTTAGTATSTLMTILASGRVGIGTSAPDASAILDLTSITGGLLVPRLSTVQKTAIVAPVAGLTLYDSTLNKLNVYNGSAWKNVGSTEIGGDVTNGTQGSVLFIGDGAVLGQDSANFNYSTSTGRLGIGTTTPLARLDVTGANNGTSPLFQLSSVAAFATTTQFIVANSGLTGIGTANPLSRLDVNGGVAVGSYAGVSAAPSNGIIVSGNLGIGTTTPFASFSLAGTAGGTTNLFAISTSTAAFATTTALSLDHNGNLSLLGGTTLSVGNTSQTNIAGDGATSTVYGPLLVRGTPTTGSSLVLQRGLNNTDNVISFNDQTGSSLLKIYTAANTGYSYINGQQSYLSLGMSVGGEVLRIDTSNNARFTGHVIPSANQTYNLGTPAVYWNNGYINNIVANNLSSASTSIAGTNNTSFSINSNNPTTDTQDMSLVFYRGAGAPTNAVMSWNSTLKRFEFNQNLYFANAATSPASTTLRVAAVAAQTGALTSWLDSSGNVLSTVLADGSIGVGTSTPWGLLSVNPNGITGPAFVVGSSTATNFIVTNAGNVGIGTASPAYKLDVNGIGNFTSLYVNGSPLAGSQWTTSGSSIYYSTGNVGIGTTTPFAMLNIATSTGKNLVLSDSGAGANLKHWLFSSQGGNLYVGTTTDAYATSSPSALTITNAGSIGIGTTSPSAKLSVVGNAYLKTATDSSSAFVVENSTATTTFSIGTSDSSNNLLSIASSTGASYFEITSAGYIGIGTTTPANALDVYSTEGIHILEGVPASTGMALYNNAGALTWNGIALATGSSTISGTTNYVPLYTGSTALGNSVIAQSGSNIGIGIASPTSLLHLSSADTAISINDTATSPRVRFLSSGTLKGLVGTDITGGTLLTGAAVNDFVIRAETQKIMFSSNGGSSAAMTINTSGNVGIGTTTPFATLQIATTTGKNLVLSDSGAGANLKHWLFSSRGGNLYVGTTTDAYATSSPAALSISNAGNVAIGGTGSTTIAGFLDVNGTGTNATSTFASNLWVKGTLQVGTGSIFLTSTGIQSRDGSISINSGTATSTFTNGLTVGTSQFLVQSATGRIGIGTTTPASILDIYGTDAIHLPVGTTAQRPSMALIGQVRYNSQTHQFEGYGDNSVWQGLGGVVNAAQTSYITAGTDDFLHFFTSSAERMTLSSTGLLGIGTTTPFASLQIATTTGKNLVLSDSGAGANLKHWLFSSQGGNLYVGTTTDAYATSSPSVLSILSSGYVGIGTAVPTVALSVVGNGQIKTTTDSSTAFVVQDSTGVNSMQVSTVLDNSNILSIATSTGQSYFEITADGKVGVGTTSPETTLTVVGAICAARSAGTQTTACGTTEGAIYANSSSLTGGYDVAEMYLTSDSLLGAGDVASFDSVHGGSIMRAATSTAPFLGIVSTNPGLTLGSLASGSLPLTLAGRVPTKVSTANGVITAGDRLMLSSTTPGVAVKALHSGQTIGVALAPYSGVANGSIDVFVSPQYWLAPGDITIDETSGSVGIGVSAPAHTLDVAGDIAAISFVNTSTRSMKTDITYLTTDEASTMLSQLVDLKVATYRYTVENQNDPLRIGLIAEDAQVIAPEILSLNGKGVDIYKFATFTLAGVQALAARVDAQNMRLISLETRLTALESGAVSVASGSPITLSTTSLASAFEGFGAIIKNGIAQFQTLVFRQLVASKDADGTSSAGSVTIAAGSALAQVTNSLVLPSTKVFVTFNSSVTGSWWVSDKVPGSFRVVLSAPQVADVSFDYFLVQTEGQIATSTPVASAAASGSDKTPPVVTLIGDNPLHLSIGGTFAEPGVSVVDDVDGTGGPVTTYVDGVKQTGATAIDTSTQTTHIITYLATDRAGNTSDAVNRSIIIGSPTAPATTATSTPASADTTAPVVTLTGAAAMQLTVGDIFTDPGATALDDTDGDLTASIAVTGAVDTATAGSYPLTYSATDLAGNTGSASRLVTIVASSTSPI